MNEPSNPAWPINQGRSRFRARTTDQLADIHREGQRLIEEAWIAREQWLDA